LILPSSISNTSQHGAVHLFPSSAQDTERTPQRAIVGTLQRELHNHHVVVGVEVVERAVHVREGGRVVLDYVGHLAATVGDANRVSVNTL
jgi:hypothetical protein